MSVVTNIERLCTQTAVYWSTPTEDGYGGLTFDSGSPQEIYCRWEDKNEIIKSDNGKEQVSRAVVYVTQDVDEDGYLFLGSLDDLDSSEEENPETAADTYRIVKFDKSPALGSTNEFIRKAWL